MSDQNVIPENTQIYANFGQPFQPGTLPEVQYLEVEPIFEAPPRISR
jgi:hypothetical protein